MLFDPMSKQVFTGKPELQINEDYYWSGGGDSKRLRATLAAREQRTAQIIKRERG